MFTIAVLLLLLASPLIILAVDKDWWKHAVIYQIYPRSFKDSNNDGIGDLNGITSKLLYLKELGVSAIWLTSIYESPDTDFGYDVSNFEKMNTKYGTMVDFENLVRKACDLGIKIIMDFVPNHTSVRHEWFVKDSTNEADYADYYVWKEGRKTNRDDSQDDPPNNWKHRFDESQSAWTYHETRKLWYLHQYAENQPDLNYRNAKVITEMQNTLKFWLSKGVAGFRMGGVSFLFEDENFGDNPSLTRKYMENQPQSYEMIYDWRQILDEASNTDGVARIMMTEAYGDLNSLILYQGGKRKGAHFTFNFDFLDRINSNSKSPTYITGIHEWLQKTSVKYISNWVLGNHDKHRLATRVGTDNVDGFNMISLLLPGITLTYNGDEIGQEDGEVPFAKGQDFNYGQTKESYKNSRDFERTPFHWDNTTNAGFTTDGTTPWLPLDGKQIKNNLNDQMAANNSHYKIYRYLTRLRKIPQFTHGSIAMYTINENVLTFSRSLPDYRTYYVVFNIDEKQKTVNLKATFNIKVSLNIVVTNVASKRKPGALDSLDGLKLDPHECLLLVEE